MIQRLLCVLLVLCVCLQVFAYDFISDNVYYTITSSSCPGTVEVTYGDNDYCGSVTIPSCVTYNGNTYSVVSIGSRAFYDCINLTSINIPNSIKTIGDFALWGCSGLSFITIPDSVASIGEGAFWGCAGLTNITIPHSVTSIGESALWGCVGLRSVTVPHSVAHIELCSFIDCSALDTMTVAGGNVLCFTKSNAKNLVQAYNDSMAIEPDSITLNPELFRFNLCAHRGLLEYKENSKSAFQAAYDAGFRYVECDVQVSRNGVPYIKHDNSNLEPDSSSLLLFDLLTWAKANNVIVELDCAGRTFINQAKAKIIYDMVHETEMQGSVVYTARYYELQYLVNTNSYDIPVCVSMQMYTPEAITNMSNQVDDFVYAMVSYDSKQPNLPQAVGAAHARDWHIKTWTVTTVDTAAINRNYGVDFILVDATKYWDLNIAEECIGQTNITFPDTTTVIESGTFETCSNSQSVTIPRSVTEIGTYAFHGCSGLTSITSLATTAPQLGVAAFEMVNDTIPVYIPCGSLQSYRAAWPHFSNFVDTIFVFFVEASTKNEVMGRAVVTTQPTCAAPTATFSAEANPGYHFSHWTDGNRQNPRTISVASDTALKAYFALTTNDTTDNLAFICQGETFFWHGRLLTEAGVYQTKLGKTQYGADSIEILTLIVDTLSTKTESAVVCRDDLPYLWRGQSLTTAGTYTAQAMSVFTCDTIVTLNLMVVTNDTIYTSASLCQGDSLLWFGQQLSEAGVYHEIIGTTIYGCDSVEQLTITLNPTFNDTVIIEISAADLPFEMNGVSLTSGGTYVSRGQSAFGCDSIVTLILDVPLNLDVVEDHQFVVSPNPVERGGTIVIEQSSTTTKSAEINLYSANGKLLSRYEITENVSDIQMPEIAGLYILQMITKSGLVKYGKILVK